MDQPPPETAPSEATSRQKSCNACARSKRKCDKLAPICSRCAERDKPCVYKRRRLAHPDKQAADHEPLVSLRRSEPDSVKHAELQVSTTPQANANDNVNSAAALPPTPFPLPALSSFEMDYMDFSDSNLADNISLAHLATTTTTVANFQAIEHNSDDPFLNFTIDPSLDSSMWLTLNQQALEVERTGTPVTEEIEATYEKMGDLCTPFDPWTLYDETTRSYYLHARMKSFPSEFAMSNTTPFLHKQLYKGSLIPPCILYCFSTCVMYTNRTDTTEGMALRALQQDIDKLLSSEVIALTPLEKLARVHVLFLYQIIRLFDGDVALRAGAENDLPLLEQWTGELCRVRDNLSGHAGNDQHEDSEGGLEQDLEAGNEAGSGSRSRSGSVKKTGSMRNLPVPESWERWIFAESVRRTILMVYSVIAMYQLMKRAPVTASSGRPNSPGPWKYIHRWTLSAPLWEAKTSFDFYRAWEQTKPHFIIENYALGEFLQRGRPELVDGFGKILLTAYVGQDATKEFLAGRRVSTTTISPE